MLKRDSGSSDLLEDVEVERAARMERVRSDSLPKDREKDARQLARVLPVGTDLPLEVEERDLVVSEVGRLGNGGRAEELAGRTTAPRNGLGGLGGGVLAEAANDFAVEGANRLHVRLGDLRLGLDETVCEGENVSKSVKAGSEASLQSFSMWS